MRVVFWCYGGFAKRCRFGDKVQGWKIGGDVVEFVQPENSAAVPGDLLRGTIGPRKTIDATPESGTDTRQPQFRTPRSFPRNVECFDHGPRRPNPTRQV